MRPENIVIVGPTSSGKTTIALLLAGYLNIPVFNCDSVQIYKDLNILSNKPVIFSQKNNNTALESKILSPKIFPFQDFANFEFKIVRRKKGIYTTNRILSFQEFYKWLLHADLAPEYTKGEQKVSHYLFDICNPGETYSAAQFCNDVKTISQKISVSSKVIVGGTIYYAYHYLRGTEFKTGEYVHLSTHTLSNEELLNELSVLDPESLNILEHNNLQRLQKAYDYIQATGKKYSDTYVKENQFIDDFLLIAILPKSREQYVSALSDIVHNRISKEAIREILLLKDKYSDAILDWLKTISYEYKYACYIAELCDFDIDKFDPHKPAIKNLIDELIIRERQYTKRQMTFIRKLLRDLK